MLAQAVSRCSSARDMDLSARSDKSQCPPPPWTHLCPLYKGTLGGRGGMVRGLSSVRAAISQLPSALLARVFSKGNPKRGFVMVFAD